MKGLRSKEINTQDSHFPSLQTSLMLPFQLHRSILVTIMLCLFITAQGSFMYLLDQSTQQVSLLLENSISLPYCSNMCFGSLCCST